MFYLCHVACGRYGCCARWMITRRRSSSNNSSRNTVEWVIVTLQWTATVTGGRDRHQSADSDGTDVACCVRCRFLSHKVSEKLVQCPQIDWNWQMMQNWVDVLDYDIKRYWKIIIILVSLISLHDSLNFFYRFRHLTVSSRSVILWNSWYI